MITREQAAKLQMGDRLVAYREAHARMGEEMPSAFEECVVLAVQIYQGTEQRECENPPITVGFGDGKTMTFIGQRLFFTMSDAAQAVRDGRAEIRRKITEDEAEWNAYLRVADPGYVNCPCRPCEATKDILADVSKQSAGEYRCGRFSAASGWKKGHRPEGECPHGHDDAGAWHKYCEECIFHPRWREPEKRHEAAPDDHGFGDEVLHRLWTKAVGTEGYDRAEWQELKRIIHQIITAR